MITTGINKIPFFIDQAKTDSIIQLICDRIKQPTPLHKGKFVFFGFIRFVG
jgi:hypothetical protein